MFQADILFGPGAAPGTGGSTDEPNNSLLTEAGERLLTEAGEYLVQE